LNRGNHPPFTRLGPTVTSPNPRSITVGARPRAHETYRVGDYVRSPFSDPQIRNILGEGYCSTARITIPVSICVYAFIITYEMTYAFQLLAALQPYIHTDILIILSVYIRVHISIHTFQLCTCLCTLIFHIHIIYISIVATHSR